MRVQLRVKRPAHPVPVRRRDQPLPRLHPLACVATPNLDRRLLSDAQGGPQRLLVRDDQLPRHTVTRHRGEHAHRLRRAERQIKRGNLRVTVRRPQPAVRLTRITPLE